MVSLCLSVVVEWVIVVVGGGLAGCVVFVEVWVGVVVGVVGGVVVSVGEPVGLSVVVSTVDEEFSVVWSVSFTKKTTGWTQGIVAFGIGEFGKVGNGIISGIGVPNSWWLFSMPAVTPRIRTGSASSAIHFSVNLFSS